MNLDSNIIKLFVLLNGERAMRLCVEGDKKHKINADAALNNCKKKCSFYTNSAWDFCFKISNEYAGYNRTGIDYLRRKDGIKNYLKKINDEFK